MSVRKTDLTTGNSTATQASYSTASVSPGAYKLILAAFVATSTFDAAPTLAGNGLTWELINVAPFNTPSANYQVYLFRSMGGAPSAGVITITLSDWPNSIGWAVAEFDGVPISGENGSDAVIQSVIGSGIAETYLSLTLDEFESPNNIVYAIFGCDVNIAITPGDGFTEIHQFSEGAPDLRGLSMWKNSKETLVEASVASVLDWGGIAIEIEGLLPPPRKGILHPDLKTAVGEGRGFAVFEFDDPGSTTHQYAGSWLTSDSLGKYKGYINKGGFGRSPRSVSLRGDRLQSISTSVTVTDKDETIKDLVTGEYSRQLRGMDARIRIVAPDIEADAFHLRFTGQVLRIKKTGVDEYQFDLGAKLSELEGFLNVPIVTKALWPNADQRAVGKRTPLVYGVHSSASLGSRGMLPTLYVDNVGFRYLVAHQYLEEITNVYVDHVVQGSGWAEENLELEGHRYTLVDFGADQGTSTITVDAKGAVYTGDIDTYTAETNPATQFKYILANYCFNTWNGKPADWHDEDDSAISQNLLWIAEQFFNSRGVKGSISIPEQMTSLAFVNLWASEFCPVFWTSDAKIGMRTDDWFYTREDWIATLPRITENEHFVGPLNYERVDDLLADEWDIGFLYSKADTEALERIRVKDTLRGWNVSEHVDLLLSESTV